MVTRNMEKTMDNKLARLLEIQHEIYDLDCARALAGWDQSVFMPEGGVEDRGYMMATLSKLIHQKKTSEELGRLLDDLVNYRSHLDPESDEAALIRLAYEDYIKGVKVPSSYVAEEARLTTMANTAWEKAKKGNDYATFQPYMDDLIGLIRQYAEFFQPYEHIYDPLLDNFERGMLTSEVQQIFNTALQPLIDLIGAIREKSQQENAFLHDTYDSEKMKAFTTDVIAQLGYDFHHGRADYSAHPFTTRFGIGDVRITSRLIPNDFRAGLYGSIHEAGHAIYDQGFPRQFARTLLANGPSSALHESQSRFYENSVGRSLAFWRYFYPRFQQDFAGQVGTVGLEDFYRGINTVQPSLIRIEADEVTYNLHIMLRMELEIAMVEGKITAKELPELWREKMRQYLGIEPESDAKGVLQDIHWSSGLFGYFPSYALGNMVGGQILATMKAEIVDLDEQIAQGHFALVREWLRNKVHRHGSRYKPQELVEKITGSRITPEPFIDYLRQKYGWIYQLD